MKRWALNTGAATVVTILGFAAPAAAADNGIETFFASQGCAVGPSTIAAAISHGFDRSAIEDYVAGARAAAKTQKVGDWLVLARDVCEIRPPMVDSELKLSDPEVRQSLVDEDNETHDGYAGCVLDGSKLFEIVQSSRGWTADKANAEYLRMLSAGLVSGDLAFYSPDWLRTPRGVMLTIGGCRNLPQMPDIRRSHQLLVKHFDALIRGDTAAEATCDSHGVPSGKFDEVAETVLGHKPLNAWMGFEIKFIAMGAGWHEGVTATQRGRPRPPMCR